LVRKAIIFQNLRRGHQHFNNIKYPLGINTLPDYLAITSKGLYIPSKIYSRIPGPKQTDNGSFVRITGSPTVKPEVSS
jgi:hypothetical protein